MIRPISFGTRLGFGFPGHAVREPVFDTPALAVLLAGSAAPEAPPVVAPELLA
jgi:hypothetical protein